MTKPRRILIDKLNTLLFGKDLRIIDGDPYTDVRDFDFSSYYPEDDYITDQELPSSNVFDIRDFGADVNNDDNSTAVNHAVEEASACNGVVLVDGGDFICTTVLLKSNVTLFISRSSSISANNTGLGYEKYKSLIYCENAENVTLTGGGKIKGNGNLFGRKPFADSNNTKQSDYIDVIEMRRDYRSQLRFAHPRKYGTPIHFVNCKNVKVSNFIIENSAFWSFKLTNCNGALIKDFVINNNRNVANADGIDISGSSNVYIDHCFISTADDGVVIKNAKWLDSRGDIENISVKNCEIISRTNAVKVGTETTYGISNVCIENCRLFMTDLYPGSVSGISLESCDGTALNNVTVNNIDMDRCTCPLFIRLGNRNRASIINASTSNAIEFGKKVKFEPCSAKDEFDNKGSVGNIVVENIKASGVELPIIIAGYKQRGITKYVENVSLSNIDITYADIPETVDKRLFIPEYSKEYPECWRFRNLPAYAIWIRHARNIEISNFKCHHPQKTWKKDVIKIDVK